MSSAEFVEWQAYQKLTGPLAPGERDDLRMAIICSTFANVMKDKKSREVKPQQFIPDWPKLYGVPDEMKSPEQVAAVGEAWYDRMFAKAKAVRR